MRPSTSVVVAVAATTCSSKWRHDARVLGSLPFYEMGFWGPPLGAIPTLVREFLFVAVGPLSLGMPAQGPSRLLRQI